MRAREERVEAGDWVAHEADVAETRAECGVGMAGRGEGGACRVGEPVVTAEDWRVAMATMEATVETVAAVVE